MKSGSAKKRASTGAKRGSAGASSQSKKRPGTDDEREETNAGTPTTPSYNLRQRDPQKKKRYTDADWDIEQAPVEEEVEVRATTPPDEEEDYEEQDTTW